MLHSWSIYPGFTWLQRRKGKFWIICNITTTYLLLSVTLRHDYFLLSSFLLWKGIHGDPGSTGPKGDKVWEKCYFCHRLIRLWNPLQWPLEVLIGLQSGSRDTVFFGLYILSWFNKLSVSEPDWMNIKHFMNPCSAKERFLFCLYLGLHWAAWDAWPEGKN